MSTDDIETRFPYTHADVERPVRPSEVRVGDYLAHAGPQGSDRCCGDRVVWAQTMGFDSFWDCEKFEITYVSSLSGRELTIFQPESLSVWRVRKDRIKRGVV